MREHKHKAPWSFGFVSQPGKTGAPGDSFASTWRRLSSDEGHGLGFRTHCGGTYTNTVNRDNQHTHTKTQPERESILRISVLTVLID